MNNIYYLMGKSSSGKDSIFKKLKNKLNMKTIVMYTTRPMRKGETEGEEYHFVGEEELEKLEKSGKVIEKRTYNTVDGPWTYFTVDDGQIDLENDRYLIIGTLESFEKMKSYYGDTAVVPIYIEVEDGLRLSRALNREKMQSKPKYLEMCRRFISDSEDFSEDKLKRAGITKKYKNVKISNCLKDICADIK